MAVRQSTAMQSDSIWDGIDVKACHSYVEGRQTREGGFCYYAHPEWGVEEPNTPDTHAAIAIFRILGLAVPDASKCENWLSEQQHPDGSYATLLIGYSALKALRLLAAQPRRDPGHFIRMWPDILRRANDKTTPPSAWFVDMLRWIELCQDHDVLPPADTRDEIIAALDRSRDRHGGFGSPGPNLPDTAVALELTARLDFTLGDEPLAFARRCESHPFGLNTSPSGSGSSLEALHAGMRILRRHGARPAYPGDVRWYVSSCQTLDGGFGRAPRAIPQLRETRRALEVLLMLREA
jgi:hypothetical protein